jgi:ATP-binding cassette subfamily C protein
VACERIAVAYPNTPKLILRDVSFSLQAGEAVGVVGPTGSGKSALVRTIVGLWQPHVGAVRIDGHPITQWSSQARGQIIGYLPQNFSLFEGTIAENICRFDPDASSEDVIDAAKTAGVHDMISRLVDGYDTLIGESGAGLSGGQSQRIALARALFRNPFLIVLDEPNSHLDGEGEAALAQAIRSVKQRGGIVVIVAHRPSVLSPVDYMLVLSEGRVRHFGKRDEVLQQLAPRPPSAQVIQENTAG